MKQALHLRLGQSLTMTPQLQQAIRLLQLSSLELQTEIQEALDSNLMLEVGEEGDDNRSASEPQVQDAEAPDDTGAQVDSDTSASMDSEAMPDELPVDSNWDDIYESIQAPSSQAATDFDDREFEIGDDSGQSLQELLRWQLGLTPFSDTDRIIAESLIDSINDDGYLTTSLEEIHQSLASDQDSDLELDEVEAVLHRIQNFEPAGVAARDLRESLLIQLRQLSNSAPVREQALQLVEHHFDLLANRDYSQLLRKLKVEEEELKDIISFIQTLNPRPGGMISDKKPEYVIPDVFVKKINNKWVVELNPDTAQRLRINHHYASLIKQVSNSADNTYMKNHLQEARWFIKSLTSRNETLLKVATCIVERQRAFLEHGEEAMKALVLHDIAEAVEMHESTISRVTTKKYMHTPRGIFELKYFFSSHVATANGGECSATAIRALLKKLIAAENTNKPLSDSKLADILSEQGINVARRTVAKYREAMNIPPSNERKRLA
ncbi:MAG: RNA polymerase factor sigma-54 [Gammaproteobacteria bacterium]